MTLATTNSRVSYNGNGVTTAFSFPYRFLQDSDLTVILVTVATGVETTQMLTTNYTVTGAGDDAGGTVTMLVAPASGTRLVIERIVPVTQEMDYIEGDNFPASSHEAALDKLTMIAQQNQSLLDRALRLPTGLADTVSVQLPYPSPSSALIWNSTGTGLTNGFPSDSEGLVGVSTFMETVLGSIDAGEARTNIGAVGLTGDETIYDVKTFDESPVIPDATDDDEPASKGQMDTAIAAAVAAAVAPATLAPTQEVRGNITATSGASLDALSAVPSWATEIIISFHGVSTNGTSPITVRAAVGGVAVASGYLGSVNEPGTATVSLSSGFQTSNNNAAAAVWHGVIRLVRGEGNRWAATSSFGRSDTVAFRAMAGSVALAGALTGFAITTNGGADTFDAGNVDWVAR